MALRTAKAVGTIKNTGTASATFVARLWYQVFDNEGISRVGPAAVNSAATTLAANATSSTITLTAPSQFLSSGWYENARMTVDITAPITKAAAYIGLLVTYTEL